MKAYGPKLFGDKGRNPGLIEEQDFKFVPKDADPDFSPEHNRMVMASVIKKTKDRETQLKKEYMNRVEERIDAGVSLLRAMARRKFNPETDDAHQFAMSHFAKKELARLRGEEILQELKSRMGIMGDIMK